MRLLNHLALYAVLFFEEKWNNLLIIVMSVIITISFVDFLVVYDRYEYVIEASDAFGYENTVVVATTKMRELVDKKEPQVDVLAVNNLDSVQSVEYITPRKLFFGCEEKKNFYIIEYTLPSEYPFRIKEGRMPINENEVLLSSNAMKACKIGEEITLTNNNEKVNVTIVGFVDDSTIVPSSGICTDVDLSQKFMTVLDMRKSVEADRHMTVCCFGNNLVCKDGTSLSERDIYSYIRITPSESYSTKDVVTEVMEVAKDCQVYTYEESLQEYKTNNENMLNQAVTKGVIAFGLLIVVISSGLAMRLQRKQRETAIYYICGLTWNKCLLTISSLYILPLVFGSIIGGTISNIKYADGGFGFFRWEYVGLSLFALFIVTVLAIIPFYLETASKSPVDIKRNVD